MKRSASKPPTGDNALSILSLAARFRGATLVVVLLVMSVAMGIVEPGFATSGNVQSIFVSAAIVALLASAQAVVVVAGSIDLSVGSVVGLVAFTTGLLLQHGMPLALAIVLALGVGLGLGLINGLLVGLGRAPAIVITIGTLNIYRGILVAEAHGTQISAYNLPDSYLGLASTDVAGLPILVWIAIVLVAAMGFFANRTVTGRRLYALGSSPEAASVMGLPKTRLIVLAFALSGLIAGVGGILWGAQYATVDSTAATGLEFTVITAVVIGGVNIFGGAGSVIGAAVGALFVATVSDALSLLAVSQFWLGAIDGGLILVAVVADSSLRTYLNRILVGGRR